MAFKNKKADKAAEPFTPEDLQKLTEKEDNIEALRKHSLFGLYSARRDANTHTKQTLFRRIVTIILIILIIILLLLFAAAAIMTQYGNLVVSLEDGAATKGIVMSEKSDFKDTKIILEANSVKDVTNITYDWLPTDLDSIDGSHNGDNYMAYTFYIKNNGVETQDVTGTLSIAGVAKSMDEAIRVSVYKNGKETIYAKPKYGTDEPEPDTTPFVDEKTIMTTETKDMKPGDTDKYTVVVWVEGNDPECVNDIMGGILRMTMRFEVADEDSENPQLS